MSLSNAYQPLPFIPYDLTCKECRPGTLGLEEVFFSVRLIATLKEIDVKTVSSMVKFSGHVAVDMLCGSTILIVGTSRQVREARDWLERAFQMQLELRRRAENV